MAWQMPQACQGRREIHRLSRGVDHDHPYLHLPAQAQFETGDSWVSGGRRYRLYGLQTCLRGTSVTGTGDTVRDCGELNVIMTQSLIHDTKPVCMNVQEIDQNNAGRMPDHCGPTSLRSGNL